MEQYITELANDIAKCCPDLVESGCGNDNCVACLAFKLIGLGYTKQIATEDVVPKSEVERLEHILNCYALQYGTVTDQQKVIDKAKAEVAREIFEEIEDVLNNIGYFDEIDFKALKKKYTEEEKVE